MIGYAIDLGQVSTWGGHVIGLSIVVAIARRHRGRFSFWREGNQTVATLEWPLKRLMASSA